MKSLDTNILLRYLLQDDKVQSARAAWFIESAADDDRRFINLVTLNELVWALSKIYGFAKPLVIDVVEKILEAGQLLVENAEAASSALDMYRNNNMDFADALIGAINRHAGFAPTVTFDKKAAQLNEFELLK